MTFETKINDRIKAAIKEGEEKWRNEGRKEGRNEGRLESLISLVKKGLISEEIAAEEAGMSIESFAEKMDTACACEDASEYGDK